MFIVQDNSDGRLLHLQQQIDELRAEVERLKSAAPNARSAEADASTDRREYMRQYMAKRRAEKKAQG